MGARCARHGNPLRGPGKRERKRSPRLLGRARTSAPRTLQRRAASERARAVERSIVMPAARGARASELVLAVLPLAVLPLAVLPLAVLPLAVIGRHRQRGTCWPRARRGCGPRRGTRRAARGAPARGRPSRSAERPLRTPCVLGAAAPIRMTGRSKLRPTRDVGITSRERDRAPIQDGPCAGSARKTPRHGGSSGGCRQAPRRTRRISTSTPQIGSAAPVRYRKPLRVASTAQSSSRWRLGLALKRAHADLFLTLLEADVTPYRSHGEGGDVSRIPDDRASDHGIDATRRFPPMGAAWVGRSLHPLTTTRGRSREPRSRRLVILQEMRVHVAVASGSVRGRSRCGSSGSVRSRLPSGAFAKERP